MADALYRDEGPWRLLRFRRSWYAEALGAAHRYGLDRNHCDELPGDATADPGGRQQ